MLHLKPISTCITILTLLASVGPADARKVRGLYPLTLCGPNLSQFCSIHGFFDLAPFRYNLAIYPGCIKWQRVATPMGYRRQRVLVCGWNAQDEAKLR